MFNKQQINNLWKKIDKGFDTATYKKRSETELKTIIQEGKLTPGMIYGYDVKTPEGTTITINQKAISNNQLDSEGIISSNDENYDGKNVLYDITEEKLNIPSKGPVILIASDNSKIYIYYDGELEDVWTNRGLQGGSHVYTQFASDDYRNFVGINLSDANYESTNAGSNALTKYDIKKCPRIKLSYDIDTHKEIITYTKNGNELTFDVETLKQLIIEGKLIPDTIYCYDIESNDGSTITIKQKALANNLLSKEGIIASEDEEYNGKNILYNPCEEKFRINEEGWTLVLKNDESKLYYFYNKHIILIVPLDDDADADNVWYGDAKICRQIINGEYKLYIGETHEVLVGYRDVSQDIVVPYGTPVYKFPCGLDVNYINNWDIPATSTDDITVFIPISENLRTPRFTSPDDVETEYIDDGDIIYYNYNNNPIFITDVEEMSSMFVDVMQNEPDNVFMGFAAVPGIRLLYQQPLNIYTKKGNQIEIDIDSLKQLIAENKLEPGVEYVYKINDLFYETTIKQKAISDNKLDTKGKIVNVDCLDDYIRDTYISINTSKYVNSDIVFDIEKDFVEYYTLTDSGAHVIKVNDNRFVAYMNGILATDKEYFEVDENKIVTVNVNSDYSVDDDLSQVLQNSEVIKITKPLLTLDCPANHISSIYIDQSYAVDPLHVLVTGDIAVEKDENGDVIYSNNKPLTKSPDVNVISWIREHTNLLCRRYNYDLGVMQIKPATDEDNRNENICMRLPKFWWKSTMIDDDHCKVDFCNEEKYVDDSWHCWEGNTLIDSEKINSFDDDGPNNDCGSGILATWMNAGSSQNRPSDNSPLNSDMYVVSSINPDDERPVTQVSQKEFKQAARNTCPNLSLITYESHQIMALLFYAFYGDIDAQKICGNNNGTNDYSFIQDVAFSDITKDTLKSNNSSNNVFWYLIDWWGNCNEFVDNLVILSNHGTVGNSYFEDYQYSEVGVLDYEGKVKRIIKVPNYDEGPTKLILGENFDLLPRIDSLYQRELVGGEDYDGDDYDLAWSDYASASGVPGGVAGRGGYGSDSGGGVACLFVYYRADYFSRYVGSRLQYTGPMVEVDSFE